MSAEHADPLAPRVQAALDELTELIRSKYPAAKFEIGYGDDPPGTYLEPVVDLDDLEEVFDVVVDRLLEMQIDEELPVYVFPKRPPERVRQRYLAKLAREAELARGMVD